jgi:2-oxo-4-hydroxy-4-carboxy--5-ureidoimidazoline (OHCU) decarboxylase
MPNSEAKKRANKKWYELNKEKHNELCLPHIRNYNEKNKDKILAKLRAKYWADKEWLILRNIDLF